MFECVVVGGLETNCYILKSNNTGIIIGSGGEPQKIIKAIACVEILFN
jgi:hypothetical protein